MSETPKPGQFTPTDYEVETLEPESQSAGKLNRIVRELRERLHIARCRPAAVSGPDVEGERRVRLERKRDEVIRYARMVHTFGTPSALENLRQALYELDELEASRG